MPVPACVDPEARVGSPAPPAARRGAAVSSTANDPGPRPPPSGRKLGRSPVEKSEVPSAPASSGPARRAPLGDSSHASRSAARYWPVPLLRAVPLLALGVAITFSPDHSARVGLLGFGVAALVGGLVLVVGSLRLLDDRSSRPLGVVQGVASLVAGALALVFSGGGLPVLVAVVTAFAVVTGALELVAGLRRRGRSPLARDWTTVGALTIVLAVAFLVVPPDYSRQLGGIEEIEGVLTSSTVLVGLLGAWGALVGVFLVIAGLSLKWQTGADAAPGPATDPTADGAPQS